MARTVYQPNAANPLLSGTRCEETKPGAGEGRAGPPFGGIDAVPHQFDLARFRHFGFVQRVRDLSAQAQVTRF